MDQADARNAGRKLNAGSVFLTVRVGKREQRQCHYPNDYSKTVFHGPTSCLNALSRERFRRIGQCSCHAKRQQNVHVTCLFTMD